MPIISFNLFGLKANPLPPTPSYIRKTQNWRIAAPALWQGGFHPVQLTSNKMMDQQMDYLHNNPMMEEYVYSPKQWVYSSAAFYILNEKNRVTLEMLE